MGARFWQLWWATAISSTGDGLVGTVALPLLALTMTRNALAIAGVTAANKAAAAAFSLPAGLLTDRVDRRDLMSACELVPGLVVGSLVAAMGLHVADLAMVYGVAVVVAVCDVTYKLALQAVFPEVVALPEQLGVGNGRLMAVDGAGEQLVGPALGGFLFGAAQRLPFFADAVSFVASAVLVRTSVPSRGAKGTHVVAGPVGQGAGAVGRHLVRPPSHRRPKARLTADLRTGFRVFNAEAALKLLAGAMAATTFSQHMVFGLLVIYGEHLLRLSPTGYGAFLAGASLLGVVGFFFGGAAQKRLGASGVIITGSLLCGLSYLGMSVAGVAVLAAVLFGLQELGTAIMNVGSITTRQQLIPRDLYGRVGSVHRLFVATAAPLGALAGGFVADAWGVRPAMLVAGALNLVVLAALTPAVRRHLPSAGRPVAGASAGTG